MKRIALEQWTLPSAWFTDLVKKATWVSSDKRCGGLISLHRQFNRVVAVALLLVLSSAAQAASQYVYDTAGRLVQAVAADGSSAQYQYDAAGNIKAIIRLAAGQLAVTAFSPSTGAPGITVTISGGGFSSVPSQNTVNFNGVAASVITASANRLTVTVPAGATTGLISVTTSAGSASSVDPFTVTTPLAITSFTPLAGVAGTSVAITGTGFETTANLNKISFNGVATGTAAATPTSLQTTVPTNVGSGRIAVSTLSGTVTSAATFFVLPSGYTTADLVSGQLAQSIATAASMSSTQRRGLFSFDASGPSDYSLALTNFVSTPAGGSVTASILGPNGSVVANCGNYSASSGQCDFHVSAAGTHTVRLDKSGTTAVSYNVIVSQNLTGTLTAGAAPVTFNATVPGQNMVYSFSATAGQAMSLAFTNNTIGKGTVYVTRPDGSVVTNSGNYQGVGAWTLDFTPNTTATYTAIVFVDGAATGQINVALLIDAAGSVATDGTPTAVTLASGQNGAYTFTAAGAATYSLAVTNFTSTPAGGWVTASVLNSSGAVVGSCGTYSATSGQCDFSVTAAGTYRVRIDPALVYAASFNLIVSQNLAGTLTAGAAPVTFNATVPGQNMVYSFSATAGQAMRLVFTNNTIGKGTVYVTRPDGSVVTNSGNYQGVGGWTLSFTPSTTANYSAIVFVDGAATGHVDVQLLSP